MGWFSKDNFCWQETIARTGFLTSVVTYVLFWLADVIKPGLVSNYMSVHWWLLTGVGFGFWWALALKEQRDRPGWNYLLAFLIGLVLLILSWNIGLNLGEYRFLVVLIAFVLPFSIAHVLRSSD